MDVPLEIMNIIQKHTSWNTMEDLDTALGKASNYWRDIRSGTSSFNIKDLKEELERIEKLEFDLKHYGNDCQKSLVDIVFETKAQLLAKFDIKNMEAYVDLLAECYESWYDLILGRITVKDMLMNDPMVTDDYAGTSHKELYEEIVLINRSKVLECQNLRRTSEYVRERVSRLGSWLQFAVEECHRYMECDEATRQRFREEEEAGRLMKQNLQCLCNVMKEVLGDRVENVIPSLFVSRSPCILTKGGKTMEMNIHDPIFKDLLKRVAADKNDCHIRNVTPLLFNMAELYWKIRQEQPDSETDDG